VIRSTPNKAWHPQAICSKYGKQAIVP